MAKHFENRRSGRFWLRAKFGKPCEGKVCEVVSLEVHLVRKSG